MIALQYILSCSDGKKDFAKFTKTLLISHSVILSSQCFSSLNVSWREQGFRLYFYSYFQSIWKDWPMTSVQWIFIGCFTYILKLSHKIKHCIRYPGGIEVRPQSPGYCNLISKSFPCYIYCMLWTLYLCVCLCTNGGLMNFYIHGEYSEYFLQP